MISMNIVKKRYKFCHINGLRHAKREGRKTKKTFIDVSTLKAKGNENERVIVVIAWLRNAFLLE